LDRPNEEGLARLPDRHWSFALHEVAPDWTDYGKENYEADLVAACQ